MSLREYLTANSGVTAAETSCNHELLHRSLAATRKMKFESFNEIRDFTTTSSTKFLYENPFAPFKFPNTVFARTNDYIYVVRVV